MSPNDTEMLLANMDEQQRLHVFQALRERYGFKIHSLERRWNTSAEAILEAIDKSADLTQRGIRGILAEATFRTVVLPRNLSHWRETPIEGTPAYDLQLDDGRGSVRVQVKLQRKEKGIPKFFRGSTDHFVVETQRTRGGKRKDNEQSRPYRINEFDVLAVCLHPSTNEWTSFVYCAMIDLRVRMRDPNLLEVMQPIAMTGDSPWSANFDRAAERFRGFVASTGNRVVPI